MPEVDEQFMRTALDCARQGRGSVEPNPMVAALLVREGVELSRGWHRRFGGPHAEIECLSAARAAGVDPRGSTMYVTLEPCCGFAGKKTPPCADAIVAAGIARVVTPMADADPNVSGRGIEMLRKTGVEVTIGVCEAEARELLAAYVKLRTTGRPWVICKWAQTREGFLALASAAGGPGANDRWISGDSSRAYAHQLRGLCDGICVGIGTVLADDPLLTNRSGKGRQPVRVVLDSQLRIPLDSRLARTSRESPTIVATTMETAAAKPQAVKELSENGVDILELAAGARGLDLGALLDALGRRQWTYLLVEGGAKVLESFVLGGLADELMVFVSPRHVGRPERGLPRFDIARVRDRVKMAEVEERRFGDDVMMRFVRRESPGSQVPKCPTTRRRTQ